MRTFAEYKKDAPNWITMANGEFYPDILTDACELYKPVLVTFGQLMKTERKMVVEKMKGRCNHGSWRCIH